MVDTDAFCKLAVSGLFQDAVDLLGADIAECSRLPALTYMLNKGKLRIEYGAANCNMMLPIARSMAIMDQGNDSWLDKLTPVQAIDPGEAQLFAVGAVTGVLVVTGDKRALRALKDISDFVEALAGQIVVLEAILIALCDQLGTEEVRQRAQVLNAQDGMFQNCFSPGTPDPLVGLMSYYSRLKIEVDPLVLWDPRPYGGI